ncbi:uncharacterized protein [Typha latifolia]|uniref:uncharacterized protein isoform X2 n=1 Tax=Typha latifolia TaxID=4733 RepID=UPI003C2E774B
MNLKLMIALLLSPSSSLLLQIAGALLLPPRGRRSDGRFGGGARIHGRGVWSPRDEGYRRRSILRWPVDFLKLHSRDCIRFSNLFSVLLLGKRSNKSSMAVLLQFFCGNVVIKLGFAGDY